MVGRQYSRRRVGKSSLETARLSLGLQHRELHASHGRVDTGRNATARSVCCHSCNQQTRRSDQTDGCGVVSEAIDHFDAIGNG